MKSASIAIIIAFALTLTVTTANSITSEVDPCWLDHKPPSILNGLPDKLGEYAGFGALTDFLSQNGFGCPEAIKQQIIQMNINFQNNEYLPRYREALVIEKWLTSKHTIYEPPDPPQVCPVCGIPHTWTQFRALALEKVARRDQLTTDIDAIAMTLALDAWELVPRPSRTAYLTWVETVITP
jgi:hypothetical protein